MKNNSPGINTGSCRLWLTWKLIRKQKLRTTAIFCGLLFSSFLLTAFGSFGYDFWVQVHEGSGESASFDHTQLVLISLVTVLLLLVAACSAILLHNLYSLTFARKWRSLTRLTALGAAPRDLLAITLLENVTLFCASVLPGCMLTLLLITSTGTRSRPPFWLTGGILLWIWAVSVLCSIRPLWSALRKPSREFTARAQKPLEHRTRRASSLSFTGFMTGRYRQANRRCHVRVIMTILAAILLYVPANYLIGTNISVQRAGLEEVYGIQYDCSPRTKAELAEAIDDCRRLSCTPASSVLCVSLSASASVTTGQLSKALRDMLCAMGWREDSFFSAYSTLYFLEDEAYAGFLEAAAISPSASAVLINRYVNRSSWTEGTAPSYQEVPLLKEQEDGSGVEVYYETSDDFQWDKTKSVSPDAVTRQIPEGLTLNGSLSLILPMSRLEGLLPSRTDYLDLHVYGRFQDTDETSFSQLEKLLGENSPGRLRHTRKILQEWYDSMSGIHKSMTAICSLLFSIAVLNLFSMLLFQYIERKRGLAILWSLGQSPGGLLKILTLEQLWNLLAGIGLGIPLSSLLCYYIYKIFRQVWQVEFVFPLEQTIFIIAAACLLSLLTILVENLLMRRQDFLKDIRESL